jgi:hypothetical protein
MRPPYLPTLLILLALAGSVSARAWYITPDGTGDAPTIQAGIDSADVADTVLVASGTYYERNIQMKAGIVLVSEGGVASCATIDAQHLHTVFWCVDCDSLTIIKGFTIANGTPYMGNPGFGGGMTIGRSPGIVIENCRFVGNTTHYGGGVFCQDCSPKFMSCIFKGNYGITEGGGLYCAYDASPTLENCLFVGNRAGWGAGLFCLVISAPKLIGCTLYANRAYDGGGAIYCREVSAPVLERTIIAYSTEGGAIVCEDEMSSVSLTCCDIYGNAGGDWTGCIADQSGVNGNISADPLFCAAEDGDFSVESCSPCLPGNHPDGYDCGGVIGAFGEGCACGATTEPTTWGTIKAMYR